MSKSHLKTMIQCRLWLFMIIFRVGVRSKSLSLQVSPCYNVQVKMMVLLEQKKNILYSPPGRWVVITPPILSINMKIEFKPQSLPWVVSSIKLRSNETHLCLQSIDSCSCFSSEVPESGSPQQWCQQDTDPRTTSPGGTSPQHSIISVRGGQTHPPGLPRCPHQTENFTWPSSLLAEAWGGHHDRQWLRLAPGGLSERI